MRTIVILLLLCADSALAADLPKARTLEEIYLAKMDEVRTLKPVLESELRLCHAFRRQQKDKVVKILGEAFMILAEPDVRYSYKTAKENTKPVAELQHEMQVLIDGCKKSVSNINFGKPEAK